MKNLPSPITTNPPHLKRDLKRFDRNQFSDRLLDVRSKIQNPKSLTKQKSTFAFSNPSDFLIPA
jgi:hypothetical protein